MAMASTSEVIATMLRDGLRIYGVKACQRHLLGTRDDDNPYVQVEFEFGVEVDPMRPQQTSPPRQEEDQKPIYEEETPFFCSEDAMKREECEIKKDSHKQIEKFKNHSLPSFYESLLNNKSKQNGPKISFAKSKCNSSGSTSNMFCNIVTCGAVDTIDAVLVSINRDNKASSNRSTANNSSSGRNRQTQKSSQKSSESKKEEQQQQNGFGDRKVVSAAFKLVGGPTCSQCGKIFKPEKMHSHMKSCRGMKAFANTIAETK